MSDTHSLDLTDIDWRTVYAVLVNELEVLHDRAKSEPVYTDDVVTLTRITAEFERQGVSLT